MGTARRAFDIAVVAIALPLAIPLGALLAAMVFIDSPGPVIYRSRRIGRGGRPFTMFKFRTMVRDAGGPLISCAGDERYTPFGRSLARSRLDELPQLWNVLKGEMGLVGPRPELEGFVREFAEEYARILTVPPGLTGPTQVEYAWEGEVLARAQAVDRARVYTEEILPLKVRIDLGYAERHSLGGDVVLLLRTLLRPAVRFARRLGVGGGERPLVLRFAPVFCLGVAVLALAGLLAAEASAAF